MISLFVYLIIGLLVLTKGSEWFVRSSAMIAHLTGLPRLMMGAILIGLATNLPEFAVSISAAWKGHGGIALANPVGSNIVNTGLIFGICLVRSRMVLDPKCLPIHGIPMLLAALLTYVLILAGSLTWIGGGTLLFACVLYVFWSFLSGKQDSPAEQLLEEVGENRWESTLSRRNLQWTASICLAIMGITCVILGSRWVLSTAVALARILELSESVIALTFIAAGTSLPELATVLAAGSRNHHDTSVGIIFGSNIYNMLGVIGISGLIGRLPVETANRLFDFPVMMLILFIPFVPLLMNRMPGRKTGWTLLTIYTIYTYSLFTIYKVFES